MSRAPGGEAPSPCSLHVVPLTLPVTILPGHLSTPPPTPDRLRLFMFVSRGSMGSGESRCLGTQMNEPIDEGMRGPERRPLVLHRLGAHVCGFQLQLQPLESARRTSAGRMSAWGHAETSRHWKVVPALRATWTANRVGHGDGWPPAGEMWSTHFVWLTE